MCDNNNNSSLNSEWRNPEWKTEWRCRLRMSSDKSHEQWHHGVQTTERRHLRNVTIAHHDISAAFHHRAPTVEGSSGADLLDSSQWVDTHQRREIYRRNFVFNCSQTNEHYTATMRHGEWGQPSTDKNAATRRRPTLPLLDAHCSAVTRTAPPTGTSRGRRRQSAMVDFPTIVCRAGGSYHFRLLYIIDLPLAFIRLAALSAGGPQISNSLTTCTSNVSAFPTGRFLWSTWNRNRKLMDYRSYHEHVYARRHIVPGRFSLHTTGRKFPQISPWSSLSFLMIVSEVSRNN